MDLDPILLARIQFAFTVSFHIVFHAKVSVGYFFGNEEDGNQPNFDKRIMTIATTIAALPSDDICKRIYHLALAINENTPREEKAA